LQLLVIILFAIVFLEDRMPLASAMAPATALALALVPPAIAIVLQRWFVRAAVRAMDRSDPACVRHCDRADLLGRIAPWLGLAGLVAATFLAGWLECIRAAIGNLPAVDELVAILPALAAAVAGWWVQEPLERRVREASLIRRLDEGRPLVAWPSRLRFVVARTRSNILLLLVPILLVVAASEALEPRIARAAPAFWASGGAEIAPLAIAMCVYLISPLLARLVLDLAPLPPGEMRSDLEEVCRASGVRVRDILVWRTDDAMVNGAVMGLVGPLRYVMLTDGLLELLPRQQLRAVMAHEIGHVRRRHLPWMLAALVALLVVASLLVEAPVRVADEAIRTAGWSVDTTIEALLWLERGAMLSATALALVLFGWLSRRIERQADSFATQYLSTAEGSRQITPQAVAAMSDALASVARHTGVSPHRPSWRHGSIAWRQAYLDRLAGLPVGALGIDRLIARLKLGVVVVLLAFAALLVIDIRRSTETSRAPSYDESSRGQRAVPTVSGARGREDHRSDHRHAFRQDARDRQ
jgi:Zn-dependent protease with chaperone function